MELLDIRRAVAGDPNLGSNIERQVVDRELQELEAEILLEPGPLAKYIAVPVSHKHLEARR